MPKHEHSPVTMTQRELDALHTVPDRLRLALASPTCLSGQLFTFLDQLQIALNAIAMRVTVMKGSPTSGQPVIYKTFLDRESQIIEQMDGMEPVLSGSDGISSSRVDWSIKPLRKTEPHDRFSRKMLPTANYLITIQWNMLKLGGEFHPRASAASNGSQQCFQKLEIWVNCADQNDEDLMFWRHSVESIRTAVEICLKMTPVVVLSETEEDYKKELIRFQDHHFPSSNARSTIRRVFIDFNLRLKWLLKNHADFPTDALDGIFLAQFFWLTGARNQTDSSSLGKVVPVFLPEQEARLRENGADQKQLLEFYEVAMDSRSLFSAFPTDTLMSIYIEQWNNEEISQGDLLLEGSRERNLRKRFYSLTSETQKREVKPMSSAGAEMTTDLEEKNHEPLAGGVVSPAKGQSAPLNIFSVPVLIGDRPIFVVQINSRDSLDAEERSVLADAVRALGGVVAFRIHFYMLREFETKRKNAVVRAALLYQTKVFYDKSGVSNLLIEDGDKVSRRGSDDEVFNSVDREFTSRKFDLLKRTLKALDTKGEELRSMSRDLLSRDDVPPGSSFNLAMAVKKAIEGVPMRLLYGMDIPTPEYDETDETIEGFLPGFIVAVQNIVVNAAAHRDKDARLIITSKRSLYEAATSEHKADYLNQPERIQLCFRDNGCGFDYNPEECRARMSGLFQVEEEIHEMGGSITVQRNGQAEADAGDVVQKGVTVSFWLPIPVPIPTNRPVEAL